MLETGVLAAFVVLIGICVSTGTSILWALAGGYIIFCLYGRHKGHGMRELLQMTVSGMRTVKNILMIFMLIGCITASWRLSGTIPYIVCHAARLIHPSVFLLLTFLMNAFLSVLTGTSFGTSATMGVICMSMARTMGVSPFFTGGAILAGAFFGDRCSPVSSSALLVSELTETGLYENIRGMIRTAAIPFLISCLLYGAVGMTMTAGTEVPDIEPLFAESFSLHPAALLPAASVLLLSFFKTEAKRNMAVSIVLASAVSVLCQGAGPAELVRTLILGYRAPDPVMAEMMNGGGLISMVKVAAIVCISSTYAGIFAGTGLLDGIRGQIKAAAKRITSFGVTLLVSVLTCMISCNQSLAIILTSQLCRETEADRGRFAVFLEDTAVVIAPLIPWSIAGAVPIETVGAPAGSMLAAWYLYLLPLCGLAGALFQAGKKRKE